MIIDAHSHISYYPSLLLTKHYLLKSMRKYHIDYSIFSLDATEFIGQDRNDKKTPKMRILELFNTALKFKKRHNNLFLLLWIKPSTTSVDEFNKIDDFIKQNINYIKGLKIHPFLSRIKMTDEKIKPYLNLARKYNLPILVHTANDEYSKISDLKIVADNNKDINFIAAHMELLSNNKDAIEVLKTTDNIYADTAWVNINIVNELSKLNLIDKIMFGSDNPIDGLNTLNNKIYKEYFKNSINLSKEDYDKLMFKNAIKIYKLHEIKF